MLACFIIISSLAITLNIKPLDITPYLQYFHTHLKVGENQFYVRKAMLSYKGSLQLYLDDITLRTPEKATISAVKHLKASFSNRSLAFGKVVVKHAYLTGLDIQLEVGEEGLEIATVKVKKEDDKPFDIISLLNEKNILSLKYLKTLEVDNSVIQITDLINGDMWIAENIKGELEKSSNRGTKLILHTNVQRSGENLSMPAALTFSHFPQAKYADISLDISNIDSKLMAKYMPDRIKNLLRGDGSIKLGAKLVEKKGIVAPYFQADLSNGAFNIDGIYNFPLPFDTFHIKGDYSKLNGHKLTIQELLIKDDKGYVLEGKGSISNIKNDPYLDLLLLSKSMPLRHLLRYLPDGKIPSTTSWIDRNVQQAIGTNIRLAYTGATSDFPCNEVGCGFDGSFNYKNLTLRFMDELTPATELAGHFIIRDGGIIIQSKKGKVSDQTVSDITVEIKDLFNKGKVKVLTVVGKASGLIQGTLDRIGEKVGADWFGGNVLGTHISNVKVTVPLKSKLTFEDVDFVVSSELNSMSYDVPVGKNKLNFKASNGTVKIQDKKLKFIASGHLAKTPVKAIWNENLRKPGLETNVDLEGVISDKQLNKLAQQFIPIESVGLTPFNLHLNKIKTNVYDYELISDFKDNSLIIPLLNWEKIDKNSMNLVARGRVEANGELFSVDSLAVTGDEVEIAGSMYLDKTGKTSLTLAPFKLGATNINATMNGDKIVLDGEYLDIAGFDILKDEKLGNDTEESDSRDIIFDANIDKINMIGGVIAPATISGERKNNRWENFVLSGQTASGANIDINMKGIADNKRHLHAVTTNAGEALRALGLYQNINKGYLTLDWYLDEGEERNKASGNLKITDTSIEKFPILAKLLSLLSLEQLFKSGNGILFDDVFFPFTVVDDVITINKAILEGPSIGMRFSGDIHTENTGNKLDIQGSLIPVQGLNKLVSNIPIVGHIITGSQDGVLVADFKVRGDYDKPDVSVNPLSVVTPGLIKDIFGAITGKKKK